MLFNSYIFIFIFLPVTVTGYYFIGRFGYLKAAIAWLVVASFFFYGWWNPVYVLLLLGSIVFNYLIGRLLCSLKEEKQLILRRFIFLLGLVVNLGFLAYYKYLDFFIKTINTLFNHNFGLKSVILPLAISFFTFQQISFLVDLYKEKADVYRENSTEYNFLNYCLFVVFFPHLIAGPITYHKEIIPQFTNRSICHFKKSKIAIGLTVFILGLAKKVILADRLAQHVSPAFAVAGTNGLTFFEAWAGVLCYAFQIYFDFSGYSDMAIGIGLMFGIRLPVNFFSPYKAVNIIDFWRRWHITLSRFLKNYLYFPLGGNRKGPARRYLNLMITMFLGGLWHGAGWTYVFWGVLHGFYLVINHAWQNSIKHTGYGMRAENWWSRTFSTMLTFLAVVVAWVFFRAENWNTAVNMLKAMAGMDGFLLWDNYRVILNKFSGLGNKLGQWGMHYGMMDFFSKEEITLLGLSFFIVFCLPNVRQFMGRYNTSLDIYQGDKSPLRWKWLYWRPDFFWVSSMVILTVVMIGCFLSKVSEFIYFQF